MDQDSAFPSLNAPFFSEHLARYYYVKDFVNSKEVLDLACGQGYGSYILSENAKQITSGDLNLKNLEFAKNNYSKENIKHIQIDATKLEKFEKKFDVIVAFEVIEHIFPEQTGPFLNGISRALKEGGVAFISTPNHDVVLKSGVEVPAFHINNFSAAQLNKELKKYFSKVEMIGQVKKRKSVLMFLQWFDFFNLRHFINRRLSKKQTATPMGAQSKDVGKIWKPDQGRGDSVNWHFSKYYWRQAGMVIAKCQK